MAAMASWIQRRRSHPPTKDSQQKDTHSTWGWACGPCDSWSDFSEKVTPPHSLQWGPSLPFSSPIFLASPHAQDMSFRGWIQVPEPSAYFPTSEPLLLLEHPFHRLHLSDPTHLSNSGSSSMKPSQIAKLVTNSSEFPPHHICCSLALIPLTVIWREQ